MQVYGVAILAGSFILGQLIGETIGNLLHINSNVGGVGFAMLMLILINQWMHKRKLISAERDKGIMFWNKMYLPVIVAMSASQNVNAALAGGFIALFAGMFAVVCCFFLVPFFNQMNKK